MSNSRDVRRPVVGVVSDLVDVDGVGVHTVRCRYIEALSITACVTPVILPAELSVQEIDDLASAHLDGLLLTGARSNVSPARYDQPTRFEEHLLDHARDKLAVSVIRAAERHEIPLFGICRGLQEMNVAFGGCLHQELTNRSIAHEEDCSRPRDEQYLASHSVQLRPSGLFSRILPSKSLLDVRVNSLHRQGVDRLGSGLIVEAVAPDGLVEAFSVGAVGSPMFAVQWHPEWFHAEDSVSRALFRAFGSFCRVAQSRREGRAQGAKKNASFIDTGVIGSRPPAVPAIDGAILTISQTRSVSGDRDDA